MLLEIADYVSNHPSKNRSKTTQISQFYRESMVRPKQSVRLRGKEVSRLRNAMGTGVTQEYFVGLRDVSFSVSTLKRMENGVPVSLELAEELADALGVSLDTILEVQPDTYSSINTDPIQESCFPASERWLSLIDESNYNMAYEMYTDSNKRDLSLDDFKFLYETSRSKYGSVINR